MRISIAFSSGAFAADAPDRAIHQLCPIRRKV
jgi:hypothetical protein